MRGGCADLDFRSCIYGWIVARQFEVRCPNFFFALLPYADSAAGIVCPLSLIFSTSFNCPSIIPYPSSLTAASPLPLAPIIWNEKILSSTRDIFPSLIRPTSCKHSVRAILQLPSSGHSSIRTSAYDPPSHSSTRDPATLALQSVLPRRTGRWLVQSIPSCYRQ